MIQTLDTPVAPGSTGEVAYSWLREGRLYKERQKFRTQLLALKKEDIIKAVIKHVVPNMEQGASVVFAGKELLEKGNLRFEKEGEKNHCQSFQSEFCGYRLIGKIKCTYI